MDDLVALVVDEVGLAEPQAWRTMELMLEFLEGRLPEEITKRVVAAIGGKRSKPGSLNGGLSGLFGIR